MHHLTQQHVEHFLADLHKAGLSDGSILNIFRYLAGVTKQAAKSGAMAKDICAEISQPKTKRKKVNALSRAQQKILEDAAIAVIRKSGYKQGMDVIIALSTGMRVGEICALRWDDVDFDSGVLRINQTLQRLNMYDQDPKRATKTIIVIDAPKSESSVRDIPMGPRLSELLRDSRQLMQGDYVVVGRYGPAEPRTLQYRLEQLLKQAQLPQVGYHALRHSFATRCVELNVDIATISKLLGHASVKLTADTYIDSFMEQRFAATRKLDELVFGNITL
jgi:integrase